MSGGRLPFDPSRLPARVPASTAAAAQSGAPADRGAVLSVSQLADRLAGAIEAGFPVSVQVRGEVSGFRDRTHWYFDIKDGGAVLGCVMFASAARRAGCTIADGQSVVVKARPQLYKPSGKLSLVVESVQLAGAGDKAAQLRALVEELRGLGWMDPARKRRLPILARRVAVITSRSGAALQDVLVTMRKRCPAVGVLVVDARVQGEGAAPELERAVREVSARARALGVDAVLLTRGGGSIEDLWCFNDRALARAIVECSVPVVAAIGHETDTTIAELVADERCATPTQAAVRLTPDARALQRQLDVQASRLSALLRREVRACAQRLAGVERSPCLRDPASLLRAHRERLDAASAALLVGLRRRVRSERERVATAAARVHAARPAAMLAQGRQRLDGAEAALDRAVRALVREASQAVEGRARQLHAISPQRVLERGYSLTQREDGAIVRRAEDVRAGEVVRTRLAAGSIVSRVEGEGGLAALPRPSSPTEAAPSGMLAKRRGRASPRRGPSRDDPHQTKLF